MSGHKQERKTQHSAARTNSKTWIWIVFGAVVVVGLGIISWWSLNRHSFVLQAGEKEVVILLRQEEEVIYTIRHDGNQDTDLRSVKVMLAGQILHVDVKQVAVLYGGQEIILEPDGALPSGTAITLGPGETFDVRINFIGQTTGGNYLYGFQIGHAPGEGEVIFELNLGYEYEIIVE
jgi:hypothetical protein